MLPQNRYWNNVLLAGLVLILAAFAGCGGGGGAVPSDSLAASGLPGL
ncbi:MAG: hypothetical protein BWX99_01767 [Deltaproteobacteria bacterium ADurb.Bin151]|nr:MAG: hypothetical protein BWX99_01767 [Deltaproteobacteria bacterium ADurb.Bin151]